jgi:ribonuclease-3
VAVASTDDAALARFTRKLGYTFRDPDLLARALTHRSASSASNERLEFLGDGLLNFAAGLLLYERDPGAAEGDLSYRRASLVRQEALAKLAGQLELGDVLILGPGEQKTGAASRASILADTLEAVLGAVFLDGGFNAAREVCARLLGESLDQAADPAHIKDPKTRLQEFLQGRGRPLPIYEVSSTEGPPHQQWFLVCCRVGSGEVTEGRAGSRKAAEQDAAEKMLACLGENVDA